MKKLFLLFLFFLFSCNEDENSVDEELNVPNSTITEDLNVSNPTITIDNMGFIDLGLSVLWGYSNLDARLPWQVGGFYAWGELSPRTDFQYENYDFFYDYNNDGKWNGYDRFADIGDCISGTQYDAATSRYGKLVHIPTLHEISEIYDKCIITYCEIEGVKGVRITGPNKNSIFIPATGYYKAGQYYYPYCEIGYPDYVYCRSGSLDSNFDNWDTFMSFDEDGRACGGDNAMLPSGMNIRPVYGQILNNGGSSSGNESGNYEKPDIGFYDFRATTSSLKIQYKIYNRNEAEVSSAKIYYGTSSNPTAYKIASVSGVLITANITGLKSGTTYYVKCVATGKGGIATTSTTKCITNY